MPLFVGETVFFGNTLTYFVPEMRRFGYEIG